MVVMAITSFRFLYTNSMRVLRALCHANGATISIIKELAKIVALK